jgi:hypothetical protein
MAARDRPGRPAAWGVIMGDWFSGLVGANVLRAQCGPRGTDDPLFGHFIKTGLRPPRQPPRGRRQESQYERKISGDDCKFRFSLEISPPEFFCGIVRVTPSLPREGEATRGGRPS